MRWYLKVLIGLCSLALLVVLIDIGLHFWIKRQLPKIINSKNDSAYIVTYKDISVSLLSSDIRVTEVVIVPKRALTDSINKLGIYGKVKSIEVNNFKTWDLLFSNKIKAKSITIIQPKLLLYKKDKKATLRETVMGPFEKIISVSDIYLKHGDIKIIESVTNKAVLSVQNINLQLEGVAITKAILDEKIPFHFRAYSFNCDSLYYHPNAFYHIKTKKIKATKSSLTIDQFEMLPSYSRREFVAKIPKESDLNTLLCQSIRVSKMDWGFKNDDFFFHCNSIDLNKATANIYRSKEPQDDLSKKHLYNKLLRELPFDLKVDTLKIHNSMVEYEEEKSFEFGAGKVSFSRFNALVTNVSSGFKKATLPDVNIKVNCLFMKSSPLNVNWSFNVMDKSDGFKIKGILTHLDAATMARFTKPYMNVSVTGVMDEVRFNFTGNDTQSSGEFAVQYDDIKFTIFQKDNREKKNKLLTFVAKVFVKKDTKEKLKEVHIDVNRIPEKSFYNLLWRSVAEGLKKILI